MLNIAIIDIGWKELDKDIIKGAIGGSETWLVRTAEELRSQGCNVTIYCNTKEEFKPDRCNVRYVSRDILKTYTLSNRPYYDFIILNRGLYLGNEPLIPLIKNCNLTDCVFVQMHDLSFIYKDIINNEQLLETGITDEIVQGVITLNEWHKHNTLTQYPCLNPDRVYYIPNGVDDKFIKPQRKKDHRVLWSSCKERGLDILVNSIAPRVRLYIPDFGVDVASYGEGSQDLDVNYLGHLSKEELYTEMSKHACWFYPGTFPETFCITLLENIQQGAYPITPFTYGMIDTIGSNNKQMIGMKYNFRDNYEEACWEAAEKIVDVINHYDKYKNKVKDLQSHIKQYKWSETARKYLDLYNESCGKYTYEGLFLVMGANSNFFKQATVAIADTWGDDLIKGKYPRYGFYIFTACDEAHPTPCIDNYTIYVDVEDDIRHTYIKTKKTLQLLDKYNITYKKLYRANTSVYVNVPKVITNIRPQNNELWGVECGYYLNYYKLDGVTTEFKFNFTIGIFFATTQSLLSLIFNNPFDENRYRPVEGDDVTIQHVISELKIPINRISIGEVKGEFPTYKICAKGDEDNVNKLSIALSKMIELKDAHKYAAINTRTIYNGDERITRGHELEHMYELDKAIREEVEK